MGLVVGLKLGSKLTQFASVDQTPPHRAGTASVGMPSI